MSIAILAHDRLARKILSAAENSIGWAVCGQLAGACWGVAGISPESLDGRRLTTCWIDSLNVRNDVGEQLLQSIANRSKPRFEALWSAAHPKPPVMAALRIDEDRLRWNVGRRSSHSVQTTHFNTGSRSFLEDLRHQRSVKTASSACPPTAAVLGTLRSPRSAF
jgi:hypothetical protein